MRSPSRVQPPQCCQTASAFYGREDTRRGAAHRYTSGYLLTYLGTGHTVGGLIGFSAAEVGELRLLREEPNHAMKKEGKR